MGKKVKRNIEQVSKYLTVNEVANKYGVSVSTIRRWSSQGKFPKPKHIGKRTIRFSLKELDEYDNECT